jgi:hypothetical protein
MRAVCHYGYRDGGGCWRCGGELLRVIIVPDPAFRRHLTALCGQCATPEEAAYANRTADCPGCGIPMCFSRRDTYNTRWVACSTRCYQRAWRRSRRIETTRTCAVCGQTFTPPRSDARYCSNACRQKHYRADRERPREQDDPHAAVPGITVRRQQQLLGLAVAISRYHNGDPVARVPTPHPRYRIPVVQDKDIRPDIWTAIAAHIFGGVALRAQQTAGQVFLETTPAALAARSTFARALTSLLKRELLAYRGSSYCLTAAGLAAGLPHEPDIPDLDRRLWLVGYSRSPYGPAEHPEWHVRTRILPSPERIVLRRGRDAGALAGDAERIEPRPWPAPDAGRQQSRALTITAPATPP